MQSAQIQPLPCEVVDQRFRARIGEHAADLLFESPGIFQTTLFSQLQKFIVRYAAPKEERQTRSQFEIADAIDRTGRGIFWISFDSEQKIRSNKYSLNGRSDACYKSTHGLAGFVETQQRPEVCIRHRPPVSA